MKRFDPSTPPRRGRAGAPRILRSACALLLVLGLAGCGKDSGNGGGSPSGATVTVSPTATVITLNQSQVFGAAVTGGKGVAIAATNGAVRAANVVTITTTVAHGLTQGQLVTISGVATAAFNGTFTVSSVPSSTTFTYGQLGVDASSGGGTAFNNAVKWFVNDVEGGNSTVGTITTSGLYTAPAALPPATTATITATGAVRTANVVTITTSAAHTFVVNQVVNISGVTDASFNGNFLVSTAPTATTFTYNQAAANAMSGNGTVSSTAVKVKAVSIGDSTASATAIVSLNSGISVQVRPTSATLGTGEALQFLATVFGSTDQTVNWFVNDIAGGNSTVGTISTNGLYAAPSTPPNATMATIAASGAVRAANRVTITTTAAHGFVVGQSVAISGVTDTSFNGSFTILTVPSTTTFTYAQTGPDATSGAGTATSNSTSVTIKAVSAADVTRSSSVVVLLTVASDPTLTSISPATVAQGSVFEDVYLTGTNFLSTSNVRVDGTALLPGEVAVLSSTLMRARIPASLLTVPGALSVDVQRLSGATSAPQTLTVVTVRPALVAASPNSATQGPGAVQFNVNGGYYGTNANPVITAEFNGGIASASVSTINVGRQASVTIDTGLPDAGLYAVGIRNASDSTLFAATNLALRPSQGPAGAGTVPVGSMPSAVAINTATGIAVVANRGADSVSRIDLTAPLPLMMPVPGTIDVGNEPTGVAVDEIRNLAVVANNNPGGPGSISIVDLATGTETSKITANIGNAPFAVGVNSLTGLALVAYQSTNHAEIIDLTLTPPAVVSTTTISTGANPQVAVDPRLNWAVVTPGGAGTLSIVDLSRRVTSVIAAAPGGASRANGVTTITTAADHSVLAGQVVFVNGVADPSFDGVFTVTAVPSSTTFTYAQPGAPNVTNSGGGSVTTTPPVATSSVGTSTRGIGINPFTQQAFLVDPSASGPLLFNLLDQVVTGIPLNEVGATTAALNPFTDIAVTVNPSLNQASIIDPRALIRLFTAPVGAGARAVAIDPGTNLALVVNETDNTVSVIRLSTGSLRSLHVSQISLPLDRQFAPGITLSSGADLPLTLIGKGFVSGSVVRLDGVALAAPSSVTDRTLTVNVPAAMLAAPHRYTVDVLDPGGAQSNVLDLTVVQAVDLVGAGGAACTAPAPKAVDIDGPRDLAVVTNSGCDSVSLIDLNTGVITDTVVVADNPQGVAVSSRLGSAVVTNRGAGTASILDLTASPPTVAESVTTGSEPLGVAFSENTNQVIVTNAASGTLTIFDAGGSRPGTVTVDARPLAVAVDPGRNLALVVQAATNNASVVDLATLTVRGRVSGLQLPTAAVFDPVSNLFIATASAGNSIVLINPDTFQSLSVRSGINPTSMAYNYRSSTLVTLNTASATFSVMDILERRLRAVLSISGSNQFAVAIHPRTNLAVLADEPNHRVLLLPLPR